MARTQYGTGHMTPDAIKSHVDRFIRLYGGVDAMKKIHRGKMFLDEFLEAQDREQTTMDKESYDAMQKEFRRRVFSNAARSRNPVVAKALNSVARNGRDSIGILTVGTKVKFPKGGTGEIVKVKKIYSHGFVEPEYTVARPDGGTFIANEGQFEVVNADTSVLREKAVNGSSSPWGFFVGEEVVIKRDPEKKKHRIKAIVGGDIILEGVGPRFDASELDTANYAGSYRTTNAVVAKAMNARAVCNASYSAALKAIMDAVNPYMDKRIKDDSSWRYPALVISKLRDVCERAVMSAGRYDGKRPPHRVYDVECVKDGFKFSGNLIVSGLLHYGDPDDVSAFDEYDMILSLGYAGKA